jgi:hypothetical protein
VENLGAGSYEAILTTRFLLSLNAGIGHRFKARSQKRKSVPGKDEWSVVGYSAAEAFDLFSLLEGNKN